MDIPKRNIGYRNKFRSEEAKKKFSEQRETKKKFSVQLKLFPEMQLRKKFPTKKFKFQNPFFFKQLKVGKDFQTNKF